MLSRCIKPFHYVTVHRIVLCDGCLACTFSEPCKTTSYGVAIKDYDHQNFLGTQMVYTFRSLLDLPPADPNTLTLWISFKRIAILAKEQIYITNVNSFVSSVGGNLGLFLGFSFFSTAIDLLGWLRNKIAMRTTTK